MTAWSADTTVCSKESSNAVDAKTQAVDDIVCLFHDYCEYGDSEEP